MCAQVTDMDFDAKQLKALKQRMEARLYANAIDQPRQEGTAKELSRHQISLTMLVQYAKECDTEDEIFQNLRQYYSLTTEPH